MRRFLAACMLALLALTACGCGQQLAFSPEELYRLPQLPAEYAALDSRINAVLADGAEYAAPATGTNLQPVQLVDLDGDGQEEAIAFFRNADDEKPLKIHVFTAEEDTYAQMAVIEGSGTGISRIDYSDLDGDGFTELVVSWRVSTDLQALAVYSLRDGEPRQLMDTSYIRYTLVDLDRNDLWEVVVLRADQMGNGIAGYYGWADGELSLRSYARISMTMAELSQKGSVRGGSLADGTPALFITGVEETGRAITDILTLRGGELNNIVLSATTGVSTEIVPFRSLYPADINGDGVTEVPWPISLSGWEDANEAYQRTDWRSYNPDGTSELVLSTYHDIEDGWYLRMPDTWRDQVLAVRGVNGDEATVTFYIRQNGPQAFLRITAITGSNRELKAARGGRFTISRRAEVIYTAELLDANGAWAYGMTEDQVRSAFSLITRDWVREDW